MNQQAPEGFAERLQRLREKRGISRRVLSELCGLSKNMIARYERKEATPSMAVLVEIAEYFDVSVGYFYGKD